MQRASAGESRSGVPCASARASAPLAENGFGYVNTATSAAPNQLAPAYRTDIVHLNDAGYAALADSVVLNRLQGSGCA